MAVKMEIAPSGKSRGTMVDVSQMVLPTIKSEPLRDLAGYLVFIYGEKKIGKTSLFSNFEESLHLYFEPGGKGLRTYGMEITYWEQFVQVMKLLASEEGARFRTVIIDTVDLAYIAYVKWFCKTEGIDHPSDNNDYGKTWDALKVRFTDAMHELTHLGKGVILISHAMEAEIKTRNQGNWTKLIPTLKDKAASYVMGASDIIGYYGYVGRNRFLVIDGSENIEAGCRLKYNFRTPSGEKITAIPMGNSDEEAYANLMTAFANLQEKTYSDIHDARFQLQDLSATLKAPMAK